MLDNLQLSLGPDEPEILVTTIEERLYQDFPHIADGFFLK